MVVDRAKPLLVFRITESQEDKAVEQSKKLM